MEIIKKLRELEDQMSLKFSKVEQENQNLSRKFFESETILRKMEAENQREQDKFQNITEQVKYDFKQLFVSSKQ